MGQGEGQDWWYSVHGGGWVGSGCAFDDGNDNGGSIGWYCIVTDDGGRNYARVSVCVCVPGHSRENNGFNYWVN